MGQFNTRCGFAIFVVKVEWAVYADCFVDKVKLVSICCEASAYGSLWVMIGEEVSDGG